MKAAVAFLAVALAVAFASFEILGSLSCGASGGAIGQGILEALPDVLKLAEKVCTRSEPWDTCLPKCEACARGELDAGAGGAKGSGASTSTGGGP